MELDRTTLAQFRLLVAVARADGRLDDAERAALEEMIGARGGDVARLLEDDIDTDTELALLSDEERRRLYHSAYALAYADGNAAAGEVTLLRQFMPNDGESSLLGQVLGEAVDTVVPGNLLPIADPVEREREVLEDVFKYATMAAVAGAMPLPGLGIVADLAVVAIQTKMVHDVGQYVGHTLDRKAITAFIGSVAGSTGLRVAVNNLARFVPGWGSAFGAATSFVSTWALGFVALRYFESGQSMNAMELKDLFRQALTEGRSTYQAKQGAVEAAQEQHARAMESLADRLERGELTRAEYEAAVASLDR